MLEVKGFATTSAASLWSLVSVARYPVAGAGWYQSTGTLVAPVDMSYQVPCSMHKLLRNRYVVLRSRGKAPGT